MNIGTNDKEKRRFYKLERIGPQLMRYSFIALHTFFIFFIFRRRNDILGNGVEKITKSCSGALKECI